MKYALAALLLACPGSVLAATHPPGAVIENAATLDLTEEGLKEITNLLPGLVPSELPIDSVSSSGGTWCFNYEFSLDNAWLAIEVADAAITPMDGYLDVTIELELMVNSDADPFDLYLELACIGDTCDGHVEPFPVTVHTTVGMDVVTGEDGNPTLDATVGELSVVYELDAEDDIELGSCGLETLKDILGFFGLDLYGFIVGLVEPQLEDAIGGFGPEIEAALEDAFGAALIQQDVDLAGTTLHVELFPADVVIDPAGVRVALNGGLSTSGASDCIAEYDPGGSLATETPPPDMGDAPAGISPDYHIGVAVSDDLGNQGLYALWQSGLLCQSLSADDGLPLDTATLLGLLAGDSFDAIFPEPEPMALQTRPREAPVLAFSGGHDLNVQVSDLGIELYAEVDHRMALVLALDLGVLAGADLNLNAATGELAIALDLGTSDLECLVSANELAPNASSDIEARCASSLGTLVDTVVGGLLADPTFTLPAFGAYGLTDLSVATAGSSGDWLGIYAWLGEVPYGSADGGLGCSSDGSGGCDSSSSGCSGGCASGGRAANRWLFLVFPLALAIRRRR